MTEPAAATTTMPDAQGPASDVATTSDTFQLFPPDQMARLRSQAPVLDTGAVTHLNSGHHGVINLRVKEALDLFLLQGATHPAPKGIWQGQAEAARAAMGGHLGVERDTLVFTRDTTEGLNLFQLSLRFNPGDNVVVLEGEHPNQVYGWLALARTEGLEVRRVPNSDSIEFADADTFAPYVDNKTRCIGISSVMFHSGQMNDVPGIAARFRPQGVQVLVDITQHVGAGRIDLAGWNVSAAAFGTHKGLGCPVGLGLLYVNPDETVLGALKDGPPPVAGAGAIANLGKDLIAAREGEAVEYHRGAQRFAHLNVSLVSTVALGANLRLLDGEIGMAQLESHLRALGRELIKGLDKLGVEVVAGKTEARKRSPNIYVVKLLHEDWKHHFLAEHIYVTHYRLGVRVSFGFYNNLRDVDLFVGSVSRGLAKRIPTSS